MSNVFPLFVLFVGFVVLVILLSSIRIIYEYERGIVLTLGKYSGLRNPGLTLIFPIIQELRKVDMRIKTADIPKQEVMTKDNIPIMINAVVYFRVENPVDAILKIEDYQYAVSRYTLAALRDVIGNHELDFVLTERQKISESIKKIVDVETSEWGVDIDSIKIQEIELPAEMKRAIAKQAEAERERRAV
ncbi:MAG: SPFH domain-containing protein, partial [Candidatus Aenigmatarchaeota archaeon]